VVQNACLRKFRSQLYQLYVYSFYLGWEVQTKFVIIFALKSLGQWWLNSQDFFFFYLNSRDWNIEKKKKEKNPTKVDFEKFVWLNYYYCY
jgi:hypothetical protein